MKSADKNPGHERGIHSSPSSLPIQSSLSFVRWPDELSRPFRSDNARTRHAFVNVIAC